MRAARIPDEPQDDSSSSSPAFEIHNLKLAFLPCTQILQVRRNLEIAESHNANVIQTRIMKLCFLLFFSLNKIHLRTKQE